MHYEDMILHKAPGSAFDDVMPYYDTVIAAMQEHDDIVRSPAIMNAKLSRAEVKL